MTPRRHKNHGSWAPLAGAAAVLVAGVLVARHYGAFEMLTMGNVERLDAWFRGFGLWAPVVFVVAWIVSCVFFMPGLPITIVGALIFGPLKGTALSALGATLGATAAFLVGRYAARGMVEGLLASNAETPADRRRREDPRLADADDHAAGAALSLQCPELRLRGDAHFARHLHARVVPVHAAGVPGVQFRRRIGAGGSVRQVLPLHGAGGRPVRAAVARFPSGFENATPTRPRSSSRKEPPSAHTCDRE